MKSAMILTLSGCLDLERGLPRAPVIFGLVPSAGVGRDQVLLLELSEPVHVMGDWPIEVERSAGPPVPIVVTAVETGLAIAPKPLWPRGTELVVAVGGGIAGEAGGLLAPVRITFTTRADGPPPVLVAVRSPTPGEPAPLNLAFVTLAVDDEADAVLDAEGVEVPLVRDRSGDGVARFALPTSRGPCRPLCPSTVYRIVALGFEVAAGALGRVETGTVVDEHPPEIVALLVFFSGGQPIFEVSAREPIYGDGRVRDANGEIVRLVAQPAPSRRLRLAPVSRLAAGELFDVEIDVEDLCGNAREVDRFPIATPKEIVISINEVVAAPLRDWSDSEGGSVPFDGAPGFGPVTTTDEWVELVNLSEGPIDLEASGIELRTVDGTPAVTPLAGAPALYFGDGGGPASWSPGEAMVLRPRGSMSSSGLVVEVAAGDQILDRVELSSEVGADHAGGAPIDVRFEGVSRRAEGGFGWCRATPGDPLLARECLTD